MVLVFNKKGDTEGGGVLIWLLVAIVVAALVIFFVWKGFDLFGGVAAVLPEKLQFNIQACKTASENIDTLRSAFCDQRRELGKNFYANCQFEDIYRSLELPNDIRCNTLIYDSISGTRKTTAESLATGGENEPIAKYHCAKMFQEGLVNEKTTFNGYVCSARFNCAELGGLQMSKIAFDTPNPNLKPGHKNNCPLDLSDVRTSGFGDTQKDGMTYVCCV